MANKKKICVIDYWTLGFEKNILPLINKLNKSKFDTSLVHFSSISSNPYGHKDEKESYIDNIKCLDFQIYTKIDLFKLFNQIKPDFVLILNVFGLLDRSIISCCKTLGIKTIYIQHGLHPQIIENVNSNSKKNFSFFDYSRKFKQYFFYIIIYFFNLLFINLNPINKVKVLFKNFLYALVNPYKWLWYPALIENQIPDKSFVYGYEDKKLLVNSFDYPEESIDVVGSVNLEPLIDNYDNSEFYNKINNGLNKQKKTILFIQSIVATNILDDDIDDYNSYFINYYNKLIKSLQNFDINIILKFHPNIEINDFINQLDLSDNIIFTKNLDLNKLIKISDLVITEPSTASLSAIFEFKPIINLRIIKNISHDLGIYRLGIGKACKTFDELKSSIGQFLSSSGKINKKQYQNVIKKYINQNEPSKNIARYLISLKTTDNK